MALKIIITGASSGIGQALAKEYDKQGAVIGLFARRKDKLIELQKTLSCKSLIFSVDVTDLAQCRLAAEEFMALHGTPDIVIANAGISSGTLTENFSDLETFKKIIATNLIGVTHTFYPFIQAFKKRGSGHLVGISSVAGIRGLPGAGAYSSSKAALTNYLESLRIELFSTNIYVTTIAPGYIKSSMTDVNDFSMPFLMPTDKAARAIIKAIKNKKKYCIVPWQMNIIGRIMYLLPIMIWDWLARRAPRKKTTPL
ncbi:SDR family oxidoreductase [Methylophilaceae bacterium]|jgi:short-subunit dehydrogenase|nr:SDR family oxidoreductase [Methylophilaceae bacterium]|tara:strand:+ start:575 stop:1339 length:765 start_codon:yes stop_codon:yes gene_type:complete